MSHLLVRAVFVCALASMLTPQAVSAKPQLLHFPMESIDEGGARLYTKDGGSAVSVPGKYGNALRFTGQALLALPLNLDQAQYPQLTVTAWVKQDAKSSGARSVFSIGSGAGFTFGVNGGVLSVKAGRTGVSFDGPKTQTEEWVFVAGVVDTSAGWARLYQGDGVSAKSGIDTTTTRPREFADPNDSEAERRAYVFVGGNNFRNWGATSRPLAIDDVRVYAGALSENEIIAIRDTRAASDEAIGETEKNERASEDSTTLQTATESTEARLPGDPPVAASDPDPTVDRTVTQVPDEIEKPDIGQPDGAPDLESAVDRAVTQVPDEIENPEIGRPDSAPEPKYASPEAAEEAARQRAEAEAAEQTRDQQQALSGSDVGKPTGERTFSGISGYRGEAQEIVELAGEFFKYISWKESKNRPCVLAINKIGWTWSGCPSAAQLPGGRRSVELPISRSGVSRIEVCSSFNDNQRLKGIRIYGPSIRPDGTLKEEPNSDAAEMNNCGKWHRAVICDEGQLATGLVIHTRPYGSLGRHEVIGLQLVCRAVGVE